MAFRLSVAAILITLGISAAHSMAAVPEWDRTTLRFATRGGYARIARLHDGALLLTYEDRGVSYVRRSADGGKTWDEPAPAAKFEFGGASNPQPLVLNDGTLWLLYNERPHDGQHPFTIRLTVSHDDGKTWTPQPKPLYVASTKFADGCWEPNAVQLKSGETDLFFANENPYRTSDEQEITLMRTSDEGKTWTDPKAVSFRAGHRDGMPVPIELASGGVVFAIEDNGLTADHQFKPTIGHVPSAKDWPKLPLTPPEPQRWGAVDGEWPKGVYAGAPYLCQLPSGTTLLSCQSDETGEPGQMTVYVGDAEARHFADPSRPFPVDPGKEGFWNSLFVKDAHTVIAVSSASINGKRGIWLIDGTVK